MNSNAVPSAVQVSGLHVSVGEALRSRISEELTNTIDKYFGRASESNVTVGKEGHGFEVDCVVRLPSGIALQAHGFGSDAHDAWDDALVKFQSCLPTNQCEHGFKCAYFSI